jgi:hypothetical protein
MNPRHASFHQPEDGAWQGEDPADAFGIPSYAITVF